MQRPWLTRPLRLNTVNSGWECPANGCPTDDGIRIDSKHFS